MTFQEQINTKNEQIKKLQSEIEILEKRQRQNVDVWCFHAKPDPREDTLFVFAIDDPHNHHEYELNGNYSTYKGRGAFTRSEIRQIIEGLQRLVGDSE